MNFGQKIRKFRREKGLTQQELELAIDAAFGHVSRIESGKLNPTKETLLKIAEVLKLSEEEIKSLLGMVLKKVDKEEIEVAIKDTQDYLDTSEYPTYLADDYFYIHNWNDKILDLLKVTPDIAELFRGRNMFEIMLHEKFRKLMDKRRWEQLIINDLVFLMRMTHYFVFPNNQVLRKLLNNLKKNPDFGKLWEKAQEKYPKAVIPGKNLIYFKNKNIEKCYYMSVINVVKYPRFRIIEYLPHK